jgi:hypothetical protein
MLLHMIEETVRRAGHANAIRESLDGVTALDHRGHSPTPIL